MRSASSPATGRPVRIRSRARPWPTRRGSRTVPRSINGTPNRLLNTPSVALRAATRRSHHNASSSPPATAWPSIAATTGLLKDMRVGPIGPSPASLRRFPEPAARAFRSKPAQNVPPAPVSTATASCGSASDRAKLSAKAAAVSESTALRTSGRSMVTVRTAPSTPLRTVLERPSLVVVFHIWVAVVDGRRVRLFDDPRAHPADQVQERPGLVIGAGGAGASERLKAHDRAGRLV